MSRGISRGISRDTSHVWGHYNEVPTCPAAHVTHWPMPRDHRSLVGPMIAPIISLISSTVNMLRPTGRDHLLFNMLFRISINF